MNYYKNDIKHVKGDTYSSAIVIEGLGQTVDSIYFTCRENLNDNAETLFQSAINDGISLVEYDEENDIRKFAVRISPSKTRNLQSGTYYYDLEVNVNSDVFTIMKGKFILEQDSTREDAEPEEEIIVLIKNSVNKINGEVISEDVLYDLGYLEDTKGLIKSSLNDLGADIEDTDTFRGYVTKINNIYDELPKTNGEGTEITLSNTKKGKIILNLNGNTAQDGTPIPSDPVDISIVTGDNTITITDEDNTESQNYTISLDTIELCKIGNFKDFIYKENNNWYLHKEIGKYSIDTSKITIREDYTNIVYGQIPKPSNYNGYNKYYDANYFTYNSFAVFTPNQTWDSANNVNKLYTGAVTKYWWVGFTKGTVLNTIKQTLEDGYVYYPLTTSTDTQITDNNLISQLELLNSAKSYDNETNISQTNDNLPFYIKAIALKKGDE